ncbi:MAG: orotate phosphoribosyltransferase-like protein [Methanomicrobiaceae archaeon]|nr:orotate phosphoribosyltransferase-like protein [Methanomicrobiaceae archaeon]MDD5418333.1 orotate phosphoribosyltransferase-like protein [Methanomicrobiaceae archaeon]
MPSLEELISKAKLLQSEGHSPAQIADELCLSTETVTWLLTQPKGGEIPKDVHIDWTTVSTYAPLLSDLAMMMLKRFLYNAEGAGGESLLPETEIPDAVVGIDLSGVPLATIVAVEEGLKLAIYHPAKYSRGATPIGSLSANFSGVAGQRVIIIDDAITTGGTLHEVVQYLKQHGAAPLAIWVIFDKRGIREVDGVPVHSLFRISRL